MKVVIVDLCVMKLNKVVDLFEESGYEMFIYYGFLDSYWIKLCINNLLECIM